MKFARLAGQDALTIAVATMLVVLGRERERDGQAFVSYTDLGDAIKRSERRAVRRAVEAVQALGVVEFVGTPRGGVIIKVARPGQAQGQGSPGPSQEQPRKRDKPRANQTVIPVGDDRALHPDRWTKAENQAGLPYTIDAVLGALYEACKGPRGGEKFTLDSYHNDRVKWRRKLLPIVKSMADRGYSLDHVRSAGAQMRTWSGRTVKFLCDGGGDGWLELLEQHRTGRARPVKKEKTQAKRRRAFGVD